MKINPGDPAYPVVLAPHEGRYGVKQSYERGIPIRLEIAARVMAGFAADPNVTNGPDLLASAALTWADALIAAYNASDPA